MNRDLQEKFGQAFKDALKFVDEDHAAAALIVLANQIAGLEHQLVQIRNSLNETAKAQHEVTSDRT